MAKVKNKIINLKKMVTSLKKAVEKLESAKEDEIEFFQDSVVARFKILVESTWKAIALILQEQDFIDTPASPRGVIHFAYEAKFLSLEERDNLLKYLSLRNFASHLYDQPQYVLVVTAAPEALVVVNNIIKRAENYS